MIPYFLKINIPNYEAIRNQLAVAVDPFVKEKLRYKDVSQEWIIDHTPLLNAFLESRKKQKIRLYRIYISAPNSELLPHVDGSTKFKSPLGLNLPILGFEKINMDWYSCPADNFKDGPYGFHGLPACRIIDFSLLKHEVSTIIDVPTFVRQDLPHGVKNNQSIPRVVLSIRFYQGHSTGREFNEVLDFEDLI
jgi:hypothetical protein